MSECEGICFTEGECTGTVKKVHVTNGARDWGTFQYCDTAIAEDRRRGFTVTPLPSETNKNEEER